MTYSRERNRDFIDYAAPVAGGFTGGVAGLYGVQAARARMLRGKAASKGEQAFANRYTTQIRANQVKDGKLPGKGKKTRVYATAPIAASTVALDAPQMYGPTAPTSYYKTEGTPDRMVGIGRRSKIGNNTVPKDIIIRRGKPSKVVPVYDPNVAVTTSSRRANSGVARRNKKGEALVYDPNQMRSQIRKARVKDINSLALARMDVRRAKGYAGSVGDALINKNKARNVGDYFGNLRKAVGKRSGLAALRLGGGSLAGAIGGGYLYSAANNALRNAGFY